MKLIPHFILTCLAAGAVLAAPLTDPGNSGIAPGAEAFPKLENKSIEIKNCRMTDGQGTPSISAKMTTDQGPVEIPTSAWTFQAPPTGACTILIDVSDLRRRAKSVSKSFGYAKEILQSLPETTHIRVKLMGRDSKQVAQSTNNQERTQLLQYLESSKAEASQGNLQGLPANMTSISMLSSACTSAIHELAADAVPGKKSIIVFSDGMDESGATPDACANNKREMIQAAKTAKVQITCFGCYKNNEDYRAGQPWMMSVSQETGGLCVGALGKEKPTVSGTDIKGCPAIVALLAKGYSSDTGQFTLNAAQVHTPGDIHVTLTRTGGSAKLKLPKELVSQALQAPAATPATENAPSQEDQERKKKIDELIVKLRAYCTEGTPAMKQVADLLEKAKPESEQTFTTAEVVSVRLQTDKALKKLLEARGEEASIMDAALKKFKEDATISQDDKKLIEKTESLLKAQAAPTLKELLTALGCTDGELPQAQPPTDPTVWYVAGGCGLVFLILLILLISRTKGKKKKARPATGVLAELRNLNSGEVWYITTQRFTIGRAADRDASIDDASVSYHHCQIRFEEGMWLLVDEGSTNKIYADGETTDRLTLRNGTMFELGSVKFLFNSNINN